jgi:hypothetical protein
LKEAKEEQARIEKLKEKQRLRQLGFVKSKFGMTFPDVNITAVSKLTETQGDVKVPEPKISVGALSVEGKVEIMFNQDFVAPEKINQDIYRNVMEVKLISSVDGSVKYGRMGTPSRRLSS